MLLDSIDYFLFLSIVFILNYILPEKYRWILLLSASIFFYMMAGATVISVPIVIILCTFTSGILIEQTSNIRKKKIYYFSGLLVNLGLLVFFKYINFFIASAIDGFNYFDHLVQGKQTINQSSVVLQLLVPLGISYITFQAIGYLIEINRGNQYSEKNLGLFATYLMFFPKLLAGPIEPAHNFIPQLRQKHEFNCNQVIEGLQRILWGLFKKLVIANRLAIYTEAVFNNYQQHSGITLIIAAIFYTIQMFTDFSGYTDMAIGSAQLLGYRLMENFDNPFIATSVSQFWRRWHISLSSWVNEYIFNPIVINYRSWNKGAVVYAAFITFLILGFWHGASWNYIIFGFLQGFILSVEFLTRKIRKRIRSNIPSWLNTVGGMLFVFGYFTFSLIFFKSQTADIAFSIIQKIISLQGSLFIDLNTMLYGIAGIIFLVFIGINGYKNNYGSLPFKTNHWFKEQLAYGMLIIGILLVGVFDGGQFIYFQF
jgi:alginate O-acetyltransferase complex protein AlgI